jgi:hypothetical protein
VQLIDAVTGANLWAENYTRAYTSDTIFEIQDDLVPTIVSTIVNHREPIPTQMAANGPWLKHHHVTASSPIDSTGWLRCPSVAEWMTRFNRKLTKRLDRGDHR